MSRLASEKRELEAQLGRSREEALAGRAARQEAESLRALVRGLELELRQERGLGPRGAGRRGQECRRLAKEVRGRAAEGRPWGRRPRPQWGPLRPCSIPAAGGSEGVGAEPAHAAEDAQQRAGAVPEGVRAGRARGLAGGRGRRPAWEVPGAWRGRVA